MPLGSPGSVQSGGRKVTAYAAGRQDGLDLAHSDHDLMKRASI
ncbi:hypothetical protein [Streptomyces seoulensis]